MTPEIEKGLRAAREMLRIPSLLRESLEPVIVIQTNGSVSVDYAPNPFLGDAIQIPYPSSLHGRLREIAAIDVRLQGAKA